ncbi:hypothetical protein Salpa_4968 [Sporomusa sp. KB1]|nr:hypothetical protein Salpa_4968 [Sporomusa sp. KB1]
MLFCGSNNVIQLICADPAIKEHVANGKVRILGVAASKRLSIPGLENLVNSSRRFHRFKREVLVSFAVLYFQNTKQKEGFYHTEHNI